MNRFTIVIAVVVLSGCRSQIHHGLDEHDANEAVAALVARGFDAKKVAEKGKKPTWAIDLDDDHATDALRVLAELKLPRPARTTTRDVTAQAALIETPGAERLRQLEALEGDIEQLIEGMDGVASAGVELAVPAPSRPGQAPAPSKASALIRVHPASLERLTQQRDALRALIAGAVEGLKPEDVVVLIDPVTSQVPVPEVGTPPANRLRAIVITLGLSMSLLAAALVTMVVSTRRKKPHGSTAPTEPAAPVPLAAVRRTPTPIQPKPVVNPNIQRRVA